MRVVPLFLCLAFSLFSAERVRVVAGSLGGALKVAHPDDTLFLEAGIYTGNFLLEKSVHLRAKGHVVLDGGKQGRVVTVRASGSSIVGLEIRNSGKDIGKQEACVWVEKSAEKFSLENSRIESCGFGVWINGAKLVSIRENTIVGEVAPAGFSEDVGNGIHLFQVEGALIENNRIKLGRDGIYISNSTNSKIISNEIHKTRFGIHYMYSHFNQVEKNRIYDSSVGIALMYSRNLFISKNHVERNHSHGLMLRTLYHSRITGNTGNANYDGIFFSGCYDDTLVGNSVDNNAVGVSVSDSRRNSIYGNAFSKNKIQIQFEDNVNIEWSEDGTGNYWSNYLGWDQNLDGRGDRPHYPSGIAEQLSFRHPLIRILLHSPALQLLQAAEKKFPVLRPPGVIDSYPLTRNPLIPAPHS